MSSTDEDLGLLWTSNNSPHSSLYVQILVTAVNDITSFHAT
jgi:hypothetical protein